MSYVPTHLDFGPRQNDGWPQGITTEGRAWVVEKMKVLLDSHRFLTLDTARIILFEATDRPDDFKGKTLYDYQFATADRALRAADGAQVWVPERYYNRRVFRFIGPDVITDPLAPDEAKTHLGKVISQLSGEHADRFHNWVDRAQIGDMFLLPHPTDSITVFCSDQSVKPASLIP